MHNYLYQLCIKAHVITHVIKATIKQHAYSSPNTTADLKNIVHRKEIVQ